MTTKEGGQNANPISAVCIAFDAEGSGSYVRSITLTPDELFRIIMEEVLAGQEGFDWSGSDISEAGAAYIANRICDRLLPPTDGEDHVTKRPATDQVAIAATPEPARCSSHPRG